MKWSKYIIVSLLVLVILALGSLLYNQYRILKNDLETNRRMMELTIPRILSDLYDHMMFNQTLGHLVGEFQGTEDFSFSSDSELTDSLQVALRKGIDEVLALNYPKLEYRVDGFVSDEFGCMIHRNHRPELPKAMNVLKAENHLCFCMILSNTLDIAMTYTNKEEVIIGESFQIIRQSFLLIIIVMVAFAYTIYTINKQKKLSDLKRDFINNLTHEFKTPIFSISLAAKSLIKKQEIATSEKLKSYVQVIDSESKRLQSQVDKILQMAVIDSGNFTMDPTLIDFHELIYEVVSSYSVILEENEGQIELDLKASNPIVTGDEVHLKNVLFNLVDNSIKYTKHTPIIRLVTSDNSSQLTFSITDNGIGINSVHQKLIFDQFFRAEKGNTHTVKGFGLGLSYVKRIVSLHRGEISLTSTPNQGTTFTLKLPRKP